MIHSYSFDLSLNAAMDDYKSTKFILSQFFRNFDFELDRILNPIYCRDAKVFKNLYMLRKISNGVKTKFPKDSYGNFSLEDTLEILNCFFNLNRDYYFYYMIYSHQRDYIPLKAFMDAIYSWEDSDYCDLTAFHDFFVKNRAEIADLLDNDPSFLFIDKFFKEHKKYKKSYIKNIEADQMQSSFISLKDKYMAKVQVIRNM